MFVAVDDDDDDDDHVDDVDHMQETSISYTHIGSARNLSWMLNMICHWYLVSV
jgi:hypothetical protein